jgi:hypothetical protein
MNLAGRVVHSLHSRRRVAPLFFVADSIGEIQSPKKRLIAASRRCLVGAVRDLRQEPADLVGRDALDRYAAEEAAEGGQVASVGCEGVRR